MQEIEVKMQYLKIKLQQQKSIIKIFFLSTISVAMLSLILSVTFLRFLISQF